MSASSDKLLADIVSELQALRLQISALQQSLAGVKMEVILTAKAKPRRRRRRRTSDPSSLIV